MRSLIPILPGSAKLAWGGLLVLVCSVFLLGCGGGSDAPPADSGSEAASSEDGPDEDAADEGEEAASEPGEDSDAMEEPDDEEEAEPEESAAKKSTPPAKAPEEQPAPEVVAEPAEVVDPRPDDVAEWEDEDFRSAKEDRDPRLLDAVAYLGESSSGDAEAAMLLVELLATSEDPEPEPKPEPKVEKKPEKKTPSEYDDYEDEMYEEDDYGDEMYEEDDYDDEMYEEDDYDDEMYEEDDYGDDMYGEEGYGPKKLEAKAPLSASYVSLTGGIVRALGANGTKEARAALEQLLAGKASVGKERAAAGAVLRTLVDYPSPENDKLLQKALTSPESFRPSSEKMTAVLKQALGQSETEPKEGEDEGAKEQDVDALVAASMANSVTAEDIRDTALPLIEKSASMRLRYDLAAYLIGKPSEEIGPRVQELVTMTHPLNVQAQIGLYRYPKTPDEMRDSFELYFTSYASSTLGRLFAVSTDEGAGLEAAVSQTQGTGAQTGTQGWSGFGDQPTGQGPQGNGRSPYDPGPPEEMYEEDYEDEYEESMEEDYSDDEMMGMDEDYSEYGDEMGGPGGSRQPLQGPGEADRLSIQKFDEVAAGNPNLPYELAKQLWGPELGGALTAKMEALTGLEEGAQLLMLAGHIPTDTMRAQLLKTLQAHWVDGPEAFASASVASETGISDPGFVAVIKSLPRREPPARAKADPTKEQSAQYAWMETAYGTVRVFCERFQKAAENSMVNQTEVLESLPFRTHSTDTLTHVYAFDWQEQVGSRLTGAPVDPMRVYYLRFEEDGLYSKVLGTYKRAVPKGSERLVKNGLWIDGGRIGPDGSNISMDVIIDRPDFNRERKATEPEPLVTQILYIEVNDPNPPKESNSG